MKNCENCGNEHDGTYGSGRFCSIKCSRGFSTKAKRTEINEKISEIYKSKRKPDIEITCKHCEKTLKVSFTKRNQMFCSQLCASKSRPWSNHDKIDWSSIHKNAYKNGRNFVAGGTTKWIKYRDIKVQGSYEFKACQILDTLKANGEIKDWFYAKDRIPYFTKDGISHTYLIDFTVLLNDESIKYIEVKGRETELDHIKWKAVTDLGHTLEIWRKTDLF
jgi:hypothetical protein